MKEVEPGELYKGQVNMLLCSILYMKHEPENCISIIKTDFIYDSMILLYYFNHLFVALNFGLSLGSPLLTIVSS